MQVISAVAEFEKDLLIERTHSGIARARASGKRFGRPSSLNGEQQQVVLERLATTQVYITPDGKYPETAPPSTGAACQTLPGRGLIPVSVKQYCHNHNSRL